jgi:hypothetical protein
MTQRRSPIVLAAVPVILLGLAVVAYKAATHPRPVPMRDFVEYYAAGAVNLRGGNPYDPDQILPVQRATGDDPDLAIATMMWNPPWALVLVTPLGLLPAKAAHLAWLAGQLAAVLASAAMLWRVYRGPAGLWPVGCAVALFFGPFFVLMWYGQVGGLLLLGLAGFLYSHARGRPAAAGAFAALTALKPHLLFAFGLVMVLDALATRRGRVALLAGAATVAAAALAAWAMNPDVYRHYFAAGWQTSGGTHVSPKDWYQPLGSYWLRRAIDPDRFAVQFLPTIVTAAVVAGYWFTRRRAWDWPAEAPRLIFASVIAAAYGAWIFDLVVLLVPVVQAAVWLTTARRGPLWWAVVVGHFVLGGLTAVAPVVAAAVSGDRGVPLHAFVYFSPATLLLYLLAGRAAEEPYLPTPFPEREGGEGS